MHALTNGFRQQLATPARLQLSNQPRAMWKRFAARLRRKPQVFSSTSDQKHPASSSTWTVERNYEVMRRAFAPAKIYYAVKANPDAKIFCLLAWHGCHFETASRGEIEQCLFHRILAERILFGNTVKKYSDSC